MAELAAGAFDQRSPRIVFFDEGRFGLKATVGRCWARRGMVPKVVVRPGYLNFYLFSAVEPQTGEDFTLFLPEVNTEMMNLYLAQLAMAYPEEPVVLVLDQAGWHRSAKLRVPPTIHLEYLPAYSPELNPVERLWRWLRRHVCRNRIFESLEELMAALETEYRRLSPPILASLCACGYLYNVN